MTTTDSQERREQCLEAGMDGLISKPVDPDELHRAIEPLLPQSREMARGPQVRERRAVSKPQSTRPVDLDGALEVVDGDVDLLRDVVEMFSEEYPTQVEALREALARQDALGVESAAHRLKGILSNVGGLTARDLARRLETMGEEGKLDGGAQVLGELDAEIERVVRFFSEPGWEQDAPGRAGG
jgi:two-component system sensor histidine kinase/response regulator